LTHLLGITSAKDAESSKSSSALLENYAISEIMKSYLNNTGRVPELRYFREHNGNEIDLLLEKDDRVFPIEIKKTKTPTPSDMKNFSLLEKLNGAERGPGAVLCLCGDPLSFGDGDHAIPIGMI
jgi:predicted AAA+ superfamily ATPase